MGDQDRRVRRTRGTLHEAFLSLVLEQGYEQTTVQDILDRADIGRSTFYAHYRDKEALLTTTFDDMRAQLETEFDRMLSARQPIEVDRPAALIFEHAHRNQRVYRAMCGRPGGALVHRHLHQVIVQLLRDRLPPNIIGDGPATEVIAQFYAAATVGVLAWWIDDDFRADPARLAADFRLLATRGTGALS
ncbi:TetR/AcrR family transcriptional regulator [Nocardia sp. NPDC058058]|uniref:TetR/AcrR family transcriptional regulator n=1 Tax=Nocardia sp. NPDC058058 TaxID=3346317 RepID=UPI0036D917FF